MGNDVPAENDQAMTDGTAKTFNTFSFKPVPNYWSFAVAETAQQEGLAQVAELLCSAFGLDRADGQPFFPARDFRAGE